MPCCGRGDRRWVYFSTHRCVQQDAIGLQKSIRGFDQSADRPGVIGTFILMLRQATCKSPCPEGSFSFCLCHFPRVAV